MWLLRALYSANLALLLIFPLVLLGAFIIGRSLRLGDAIFGLGLYLFGLGEFIHYFVWKINMRPGEWRRFISSRPADPRAFLAMSTRERDARHANRRFLELTQWSSPGPNCTEIRSGIGYT